MNIEIIEDVILIENLFSNEEINIILNEINNTEWEIPITNINYYNRKNIENVFSEYKIYLEKFLYTKYKKEYVLKTGGVWVNKVVPSTNTNDDFHTDDADLSIVIYLNDNFTGGEFQYIDNMNNNIEIKTKIGLSLIMNTELRHKVLPVKSGERLSLVCFFNLKPKNFKTLL